MVPRLQPHTPSKPNLSNLSTVNWCNFGHFSAFFNHCFVINQLISLYTCHLWHWGHPLSIQIEKIKKWNLKGLGGYELRRIRVKKITWPKLPRLWGNFGHSKLYHGNLSNNTLYIWKWYQMLAMDFLWTSDSKKVPTTLYLSSYVVIIEQTL